MLILFLSFISSCRDLIIIMRWWDEMRWKRSDGWWERIPLFLLIESSNLCLPFDGMENPCPFLLFFYIEKRAPKMRRNYERETAPIWASVTILVVWGMDGDDAFFLFLVCLNHYYPLPMVVSVNVYDHQIKCVVMLLPTWLPHLCEVLSPFSPISLLFSYPYAHLCVWVLFWERNKCVLTTHRYNRRYSPENYRSLREKRLVL